MAHGRRKVAQSQFESLLATYRQHPEAHAQAARAAAMDSRTARRAWEEGLDGHHNHAPIKLLIADEQIAARARKVEIQQSEAQSAKEARDKARQDAIEHHAKEGKLAGANLNNAVVATGISASVLTAAFRAAPWVSKQLDACATEGDTAEPCKACGRPWPPGQVLTWIERAMRIAGQVLVHATGSVELFRLHVGEPQKLIGIHQVPDQTPEEMLAVLDRHREMLQASIATAGRVKPKELPKAVIH